MTADELIRVERPSTALLRQLDSERERADREQARADHAERTVVIARGWRDHWQARAAVAQPRIARLLDANAAAWARVRFWRGVAWACGAVALVGWLVVLLLAVALVRLGA